MKARILIWVCLILSSGVLFAHPIHVSIVNIDYISDSNRVEFSVRLFYDDFQALINHKYNTELDFTKRTRLTSKEQNAINEYIRSSLIFTDEDSSILESKFKAWKKEDMSIWLYFCANVVPEMKEIQLRNTLLLDLYIDQKNLVIANSKGNQQGYEFDRHNKVFNIVF